MNEPPSRETKMIVSRVSMLNRSLSSDFAGGSCAAKFSRIPITSRRSSVPRQLGRPDTFLRSIWKIFLIFCKLQGILDKETINFLTIKIITEIWFRPKASSPTQILFRASFCSAEQHWNVRQNSTEMFVRTALKC